MTSLTAFTLLPSPVGTLLLMGHGGRLAMVNFQEGPHPVDPAPDWVEDPRPFRSAIDQLQAYFAGRLKKFDLKVAAEGTAFQRRVWAALTTIPYGTTVSYGDIARRIGRARAARAVGAANGKNPVSIIVPCHRVIGHSGDLVGYGGGMEIKRALLALERRVARHSNEQTQLF